MIDHERLNTLLDAFQHAIETDEKDAADLRADDIRAYFRELFLNRQIMPLTINYRCFRCGGVPHHGRCKTDEADPFIEWVEPLGNGSEPVFMRARASDIAKVRRRHEPRYESDERAIDDFLVVNFAYYVTDTAHYARGGGPVTELDEVALTQRPNILLRDLLRGFYSTAYKDGTTSNYAIGRRTQHLMPQIIDLFSTKKEES